MENIEIKKNPTLEEFGINITIQAINGDLDDVFGRDVELNELVKILSRKKKNNAIMVGDAGTGKSCMINLLAKRIVEQKVPHGLLNKIIYSIDSATITANTKYRGEFESRLKKILTEAEEDDRVIIFIDEIHTIMDNGNNNTMNIANIMKPHLTSGKLQVVGATTFEEYKKHFEKDSALSRRFNKLVIEEPSIENCIEIIKKIIPTYEEFHNVSFTDDIISKIPVLAKKYIRDRFLPDSAIDVIDELGARIKVDKTNPTPKMLKLFDEMKNLQKRKIDLIKAEDWEEIAFFKPNVLDKHQNKINIEQENFISKFKNIGKTVITEQDLLSVVSKISKIPLDKMNKDGKQNIKKLEIVLDRELINQDEAKHKILKALKRNVMGFNKPNKPVASFLMLGVTGSGKSLVAKLIADNWYDGNIIRMDMGEYQEKISSTTLVGSAPGYVGYEEGGNLTEQVKRNPYSLILLDEIEKAHKDVLNMFLTILDEGYCTDAKGKKIDFRNCIIIMTSNLGAKDSEYRKPGFGGGTEIKISDTSIESAKKHFTPELWNRIDQVIVFNRLEKNDIFKIMELELDNVKTMMKNVQGININISKKLKEIIVEKGYDKLLGARPLKRVIETLVVDEITDYVMDVIDIPKKITLNWNEKTEKVEIVREDKVVVEIV